MRNNNKPTHIPLSRYQISIILGLLLLCAGCGRREYTAKRRGEILNAITANNLRQVRLLLPRQGTPDFDKASYDKFLDVAATQFAEVAGTPAAKERLPVIYELMRHFRRIIGKPVDVIGKIEVNLAPGVNDDSAVARLMLKSTDGSEYPLDISRDETRYRNASVEGQRFLVNFDATYNIRGYIVDKHLEAEEVDLVRGKDLGHGIVIPMGLALRSTEDVILLHLKEEQPASVSDAAKNGDLKVIKALLKRNPRLVSSRDDRGATPLFWAAFYGHLNVVKFLVANGADVNAKDEHGETPLAAAANVHKGVAEFLRRHGGHE